MGTVAHAGELSWCVCVWVGGRWGAVSACSAFLRCCQHSSRHNYPSVEQAALKFNSKLEEEEANERSKRR